MEACVLNKRATISIIMKRKGTQENEMEECVLNKRAIISKIMKIEANTRA